MNNKQMLHALRDKMSAEMGVFEDWLLTLPPKEILEHRADSLLKLQREKQWDTPEKKSVTERLHQKPSVSSGPKHPPVKGDGAR